MEVSDHPAQDHVDRCCVERWCQQDQKGLDGVERGGRSKEVVCCAASIAGDLDCVWSVVSGWKACRLTESAHDEWVHVIGSGLDALVYMGQCCDVEQHRKGNCCW